MTFDDCQIFQMSLAHKKVIHAFRIDRIYEIYSNENDSVILIY